MWQFTSWLMICTTAACLWLSICQQFCAPAWQGLGPGKNQQSWMRRAVANATVARIPSLSACGVPGLARGVSRPCQRRRQPSMPTSRLANHSQTHSSQLLLRNAAQLVLFRCRHAARSSIAAALHPMCMHSYMTLRLCHKYIMTHTHDHTFFDVMLVSLCCAVYFA